MGEMNHKFKSLTPVKLDENKEIYTEAFDFVFSDSDIKNIAITGIYGAGKSSVWKTYVSERNLNNIITISLGKYEDNKNESSIANDPNEFERNETSTNIENNRIERQIINQILSQVKTSKVYLSKYIFKKNKTIFSIFCNIFNIILFVFAIVSMSFKNYINSLVSTYSINKGIVLVGYLFIILFPIGYFSYKFIKFNRVNISKINLNGTEAIFDNNSVGGEETLLERDMKEIVYLLDSSDSEIVVFEDLDRYDNIEIFTKLKELNFLLNSFISKSTKNNKKVVRFIYMVRDGLFLSKNRPKFFDFIIPIVPVIDSKNSESILWKELQKAINIPNKNVIIKISLYIDDMRLLKNIVNEYLVYENVIDVKQLDLEKDKLFSLITFKNIFPKEFDLLQENKGYISNIFDKINEYRKKLQGEYKEQVDEISDKIEKYKDRFYRNKFEVMALSIPIYISFPKDNHYETWTQFLMDYSTKPDEQFHIYECCEKWGYINYGKEILTYSKLLEKYNVENDENKELISQFEFEKEKLIKELLSKKLEIENKLRSINLHTLKEILRDLSETERDDFFKTEECMVKSQYFNLTKFLILEGLIDETYWHYKSFFYPGSLGKNDTIFIKNLLESKEQDVLFEIENPEEVVNRLSIEDFSRFNILNKRLFECCLIKNNSYTLKITESVQRNNKYINLIKIMDNLNFNELRSYVCILIVNKIEFLLKLLKVASDSSSYTFENILISICTSNEITEEKIVKFIKYIEQHERLIDLVDENDLNSFINNIRRFKIKFKNLSNYGSNIYRLKMIEKNQSYELNVDNVKIITNTLLDKSIGYGNLLNEIYESDILNKCRDYVQNNFEQFVCDYIDGNTNKEKYTNSKELLIEILVSNINIDYKEKYVYDNETKLDNIQRLKSIINNDNIFNDFFNKDKIELNKDNIYFYFNSVEAYSYSFLNYLNRNLNSDNVDDVLEGNSEVCNILVNDHEISDKVFDLMIKYVDEGVEEISEDISSYRVDKLIDNKLFSITEHNISILVKNKWNLKILELIKQNQEDDEEDRIIEFILSNKPEINLIYMLIDCVSFHNACKYIDFIEEIEIEKIDPAKTNLLTYVVEKYLSQDNIDYICKNFEDFELLQDKFIVELDRTSRLLKLKNQNLNKSVLLAILSNENINLDKKIKLIIIKIENDTSFEELSSYIKCVKEISDLANVWKGYQPKVDNQHKKEIAEALIGNNYAKPRKFEKSGEKRIMFKK